MQGQTCDDSTNGTFLNLVRHDYDFNWTIYNVCYNRASCGDSCKNFGDLVTNSLKSSYEHLRWKTISNDTLKDWQKNGTTDTLLIFLRIVFS